MRNVTRAIGLVITVILVSACSSTTMSGSWADPDFTKQVENVYIIGMTEKDTTRRIFEDTFGRLLASKGVKTVSSYTDLPNSTSPDREAIIERMTAEGCDSVLLTKLVDTRTETVTSPGHVSGYNSRPYYGGRGGAYNNWGSYYGRRSDVVYTPPTSTDFVILTIESVLYDLETEEMIWSGQLETVVEGNLEKMVQDFANIVSKDLTEKGII